MAPRTRMFLAAAAVIVGLLLIGDVIPRLIISQLNKVPEGFSTTLVTQPTELTLRRPDCSEDCLTTLPDATLTTTVRTSASSSLPPKEANKALMVTAEITLADVATATEVTEVLKESAYPVTTPVATLIADTPWGQRSEEAGEREGLEYFFPPSTEKRSYPFYDLIAGQSAPIDFVAETTDSHYLFHQRLDALELTSFPPLTGVAKEFFTPEELSDFGYLATTPVTLRAFYTVERTLEVEPETGTILNRDEFYRIYYAAEAAQDYSPLRAALTYHAQWDQATRDAALAHATPVNRTLDALAIIAWVAKAILTAFVLWLIRRVVRARRQG